MEAAQLNYFFLREHPSSICTIISCVLPILSPGYPFEILNTVIMFIAVFVIYLWFIQRIWNESACNKPVKVMPGNISIFP